MSTDSNMCTNVGRLTWRSAAASDVVNQAVAGFTSTAVPVATSVRIWLSVPGFRAERDPLPAHAQRGRGLQLSDQLLGDCWVDLIRTKEHRRESRNGNPLEAKEA